MVCRLSFGRRCGASRTLSCDAQAMNQDEIGVVVDCGGFHNRERVKLMSYRAAPVQVWSLVS